MSHSYERTDFVITFLLDQLTCKNHNCKRLNVIFIALSPRSPPTPPTLWVDCINDYMYKEYPHSLLTIVPKCQVPAKSCMLCLRIGKSCLITALQRYWFAFFCCRNMSSSLVDKCIIILDYIMLLCAYNYKVNTLYIDVCSINY